jgi:hypothetical protein
MAKLTARTDLNVGTELIIDEPNRTYELVAAGNLVAKDGVTIQALYGKFVDLWATSTYQDSPFPMNALDALSGQYLIGVDAGGNPNGWKPLNDTTRDMQRDGGWEEYNATGGLGRVYTGIGGLGGVNVGAQLYYQTTVAGAPVNFVFTDQANQGVQVFGDITEDATTTTFDNRTYFKGYVREQGKKFKDSVLADTGKVATGAYIVNVLLSNEDDLAISDLDAEMTNAPYNNITADFFTVAQQRDVGGVDYDYKIIVDGNNATLEQIYTKLQYLLRQNSDINDGGTAGVVNGQTADLLAIFVGDILETSTSVYIDNIQNADSNRIKFKDDGGTFRLNPFEAAGVMSFNAVMVGAGSSYRLMYTNGPGAGDDYGEAGAITVLDAASSPITGVISTGSISFTFDYDGDAIGGTAGTDKPVTLIGIRPNSSKFAVATGVLTQSKSIPLGLVAETDRAYL